jgi:hypothetical protein
MVRFVSLASLAILLGALPAPATAAAPGREPGTYWEQTVEMQMTGFAMPPQTSKVCMPKGSWEEPPKGRDDGKCEMTDVKRTGSRMTWKLKCQDGTTGQGDMTYGPESFSGTMAMHTQGQDVQMKMKGRKLGGDCDAGEMKRKVAEMKQQVEDQQAAQARAQAQACEDAASSMQLSAFVPFYPTVPVSCADASKFCARLETREGLVAFRKGSREEGARAKAEKLCKKDLAAIEARLCTASAKELDQSKRLEGDALEFVFASCPDQAKAIAKRECAGRKFTALPEAQRDFCTKYARGRLEGNDEREPARPAQVPAAEDVKSRIMRGLFNQ